MTIRRAPSGPIIPGTPVPAGSNIGQLLQWDGSAWVEGSVGANPGELLQWNGTAWVPGPVGAVAGQPLQWDAINKQWVPGSTLIFQAIDLAGQRILNQGFAISTPAQITQAQTDDYNVGPNIDVVRQDVDANGRSITGFINLGVSSFVLFNINAGPTVDILVLHENASSAANNRVLCPNNATFSIPNNDSAILAYDFVNSRWRISN